jgi:hypothetical protein
MPPTEPIQCRDHGVFNKTLSDHEERLNTVENNQSDLRDPENGALAQRPTKEDLKDSVNGLKWFIGILVVILMTVQSASFIYTRNVSEEVGDVEKAQYVLKERVDREVVTKHDLECLEARLVSQLKDMRRGNREYSREYSRE